MFVGVPFEFAPCVDDLLFGALPIITDDIDTPEVRADRPALNASVTT
jgi:hypothetical protein